MSRNFDHLIELAQEADGDESVLEGLFEQAYHMGLADANVADIIDIDEEEDDWLV